MKNKIKNLFKAKTWRRSLIISGLSLAVVAGVTSAAFVGPSVTAPDNPENFKSLATIYNKITTNTLSLGNSADPTTGTALTLETLWDSVKNLTTDTITTADKVLVGEKFINRDGEGKLQVVTGTLETGGLPHSGVSTCYDSSGSVVTCGGSDYPNQDGDNYEALDYTDNGDGTVTDNITTLMWQKGNLAGTKTWQNALKYCDNLALCNDDTWSGNETTPGDCSSNGGAKYSDWALPNIKELVSILDYSQSNPAADAVLSMQSEHYWSATSFSNFPGNAWYVNFSYGYASDDARTSTRQVVCARRP